LRQRVVALLAVRFDKYFHNSTGTHIIRQMEGTEFSAFPVKGFGDFADEAHDDYLKKLNTGVEHLNEGDLRSLESRLTKIAPSAKKKYELQVELPEQINAELTARAKAGNLSLAAYIQQMLARRLPAYDVSNEFLKAWLAAIDQEGRPAMQTAGGARQTQVILPLGAIDLRRLNAIAMTPASGGCKLPNFCSA
jgi:hypothetical protein